MQIKVQDDKCMCCHTKHTEKNPITVHHSIPQRQNPKDNVLVPVCLKCHSEINDNDIDGLKKRLYAAVNHLKSTFQKIERATIGDVFKKKK